MISLSDSYFAPKKQHQHALTPYAVVHCFEAFHILELMQAISSPSLVIPPAFMGYIVFIFPFVHSYVRSLLSITFKEFTTKFLVKVSLSEYISLTTQQNAFIFGPWVPERACFYAMRV